MSTIIRLTLVTLLIIAGTLGYVLLAHDPSPSGILKGLGFTSTFLVGCIGIVKIAWSADPPKPTARESEELTP